MNKPNKCIFIFCNFCKNVIRITYNMIHEHAVNQLILIFLADWWGI